MKPAAYLHDSQLTAFAVVQGDPREQQEGAQECQ